MPRARQRHYVLRCAARSATAHTKIANVTPGEPMRDAAYAMSLISAGAIYARRKDVYNARDLRRSSERTPDT